MEDDCFLKRNFLHSKGIASIHRVFCKSSKHHRGTCIAVKLWFFRMFAVFCFFTILFRPLRLRILRRDPTPPRNPLGQPHVFLYSIISAISHFRLGTRVRIMGTRNRSTVYPSLNRPVGHNNSRTKNGSVSSDCRFTWIFPKIIEYTGFFRALTIAALIGGYLLSYRHTQIGVLYENCSFRKILQIPLGRNRIKDAPATA